MKLGDFFDSAPFARPVNPKEVGFTAVCKGKFLPNGQPNVHGQTAAKITGCFVFLGDELSEARVEARKALRERFGDKDPKTGFVTPAPTSDDDFDIEFGYQLLWRALHEWDSDARKAGLRLFPTVKSLREMVELYECNRLRAQYIDYVREEHPEGVSPETFRGVDKGSEATP